MILASSSTERTMTRLCDVGIAAAVPDAPKGTPDDPNLQRFCDRFNLPAYQVPFQTIIKLSGATRCRGAFGSARSTPTSRAGAGSSSTSTRSCRSTG